ncbi:hypothetical protein L6255_03855 [Candidatus Parcubacteria bacterium]|nr:hypothetical protein [Candidatus Parcubacteria bacterium]
MKLVLFDFMNLMHRAYHAYPRTLATKDGTQTNAVYGLSNIVLNSLKKLAPTYVICATEKGPSFRHLVFAPYKENRGWRRERPQEAEEFDKQVPLAEEVLGTLGIPVITCGGYEADDVIGTISKSVNSKIEIIIVSSDLDFMQLVNKNTFVFRPARPPYIKEKLFGEADVKEKYQLAPAQLIDFKAIRGDPSDNIPGVYGIGEKVAQKLVAQFGSVENIYSHISQVTPASVQKKLAEGAEQAVLCKKLSTIVTNAPITVDLDSSRWMGITPQAIELFTQLEFKSLVPKAKTAPSKQANTPQNQLNFFG